MPTTALPHGSWPTPVTSRVVVAEAAGLSEVRVDGDRVIWAETRPAEGGRTALVRREPGGSNTELLALGQNARSAVHEYGGAAWWARDGVVWFCSWRDQRLYRREPDTCEAEPRWRADGSLAFISDRTGWWNVYTSSPEARLAALIEMEAEIGVPGWAFGTARYCFLADGRVVFAYCPNGIDRLAVRLTDGSVEDLDLPFSLVRAVAAFGDSSAVVIGSSPTSEASVTRIELEEGAAIAGQETLRPARSLDELGVGQELISTPEPIDFPSGGGRTSHALLYRPRNPSFTGPDDALPPLYVGVHGGPTSAVRPALDLEVQFWTSRGFMAVAVNYGGSTGYGRAYRDLLKGTWGVVDVEDCIAAARWLADQGWGDPARMRVAGGAAGGS